MITAPDAVYVIIPCMKELGMSWSEIKSTPRHELVALLGAAGNYNILHQFDGYSPEDISKMAKDKPHVRSDYNKSMNLKRAYEVRSGAKKRETEITSFKQLM